MSNTAQQHGLRINKDIHQKFASTMVMPLLHGEIAVPLGEEPLAKVGLVDGISATWYAQLPVAGARPSREEWSVSASKN